MLSGKNYLLLWCLLLAGGWGTAQTNAYHRLVVQADSLYTARQYQAAGMAYSSAFAALQGRGIVNDRYSAACAWSAVGQPDSAFANLLRIARVSGYADLNRLLIDPALDSIRKDGRWKILLDLVAGNRREYQRINGIDTLLSTKLDTIFREDQRLRLRAEQLASVHGFNSDVYKDIWRQIRRQDSVNTRSVQAILDRYGWLGADRIGLSGNQTLFLVIQHSKLEVQLRYLPMMREAASRGDASPGSLALLEDRVALQQGRKQRYGTQVLCTKPDQCEVDNLDDPLHVDERRAAVGLPPMAEYLRQWNLPWDAAAYLKKQQEKR